MAHCLIQVTILTPGSFIFYLYVPVKGSRHDMILYGKDNLEESMQHDLGIEGKQFYVFGHFEFVMRPWMQIG